MDGSILVDGTLVRIVLSALGIYGVLLLLTRLAGLRSFSKMSSFDFPLTVALGSIVASVAISGEPALLRGIVALGAIYALQGAVSSLRRRSPAIRRAVDNEPLLLMANGRVLDDHLVQARLTPDDLRQKLRLAGVTHSDQVFAVVFEMTGDVSVLQTGEPVDPWIVDGVRGAEHLTFPPPENRGA